MQNRKKIKSVLKNATKVVDYSMMAVAYIGFLSLVYYRAYRGQYKDAEFFKNKRNK